MIRLAALLLPIALPAFSEIRIGAPVPPLEIAGRPVVTAGRATVVVFLSTKCPISAAYNDRMSALYREYEPRGVQFVFADANSNEAPAEVAAYAKSADFPFPVVLDAANHLADLLDARATPESFLIGPDGVLRYHGAIDDAQNEARVKARSLRDALDAVLAGKPVARPETKAFGCTIKRVRRTT